MFPLIPHDYPVFSAENGVFVFGVDNDAIAALSGSEFVAPGNHGTKVLTVYLRRVIIIIR
ncbi:MAG: hypothetical protein D6675_12935 [Gemmatimonadetes bacterium]|nr:MAG: hypothetical protein D6675_12935 [Gemmatimonadota bacterium]